MGWNKGAVRKSIEGRTEMKIHYRIKKIEFINTETVFISQYRMLRIWVSINDRGIGRFIIDKTCYCDSFEDANNRIQTHIKNILRAGCWSDRKSQVVLMKKVDIL